MHSKYPLVSGLLFGVIAVLQALRAFNHWPMQVGTWVVPVWVSWMAVVVAGSLCVWALQLALTATTRNRLLPR